MRRFLVTVFILLSTLAAPSAFDSHAQAQPGDPPLLDRITIAPADDPGSVTISGTSGAVSGGAYVAVRNLDSGATAYDHAGATGSFSVQIAGTVSSPYWISPSEQALAAGNGSLPGGPGAILHNVLASAPTPTPAVTALTIDGSLDDWGAYPDALRLSAETGETYALRNAASLYAAFSGANAASAYAQVEIRFTVDTISYAVTLNPRQSQAAALLRTNPSARPLAPLIVAARQVPGTLELRIPLHFVARAERVTLDAVRWLDADGVIIAADTLDVELRQLDSIDGITRPGTAGTAFSTAGTRDDHAWLADGQIDTLAASPGSTLTILLDVDYARSDLPADAEIVGQIAVQQIAQRVGREMRAVSGVDANNGWSSVLTAGGLPIDNLPGSLTLGETRAQPYKLIRDESSTRFPLDFSLTLPHDLPPGLYVPYFSGAVETADGTRTPWTADGAQLPLVINVGGVTSVRLPWTLLADDASDGSRGVLALEDQNEAALSNRVRFNAPTYILQPFKPGTRDAIAYPLEPYLLNQLGNDYNTSSAPLIPFQFPGQISARVTRPDGTVDDLGSASIVQNRLSSELVDERVLFGEQSPINEYRLATLNAEFSAYQFKQYGEYTINLSGGLEDAWGNRYDGGGTYKLLAAELLDLTPGTMFGTPFQVGDALNAGLHLAPGVPATVTVTLRVYPLDGSAVIERVISGQANAGGYFQPSDAPFVFNTPGEYVIDYEARYRDADRRLWAASARGAGVIVGVDSALAAHGERGLPSVTSNLRPAWFNLQQYLQAARIGSTQNSLSFPYHSGDVIWVDDGRDSRIEPRIRVQDRGSGYADWLSAALPEDNIPQRANRGELPVPLLAGSDSYTYVSAVRPNVTVRQFVAGSETGGLTLGWDEDDPLNGQIGAGANGNAPGDFVFLFGGAVVRAGDARDTAIYGALALITDGEAVRVYPPDRGAAGGADGGALLTIGGQAVDTFINLTGVQPGDVLTLGDTVTLAGQVAPTLAATVMTTFTSPSGQMRQYSGRSNVIGAFFDPADQFAVDEVGIWSVEVQVTQDGVSSAGQLEPPYPEGSVLGARDRRFTFFVLPPDAPPLDWNPLLRDTLIPILSPYNFSFTLPEDWSNVRVSYVLTTPGLMIESGSLAINGRSFSYVYSEAAQNDVFPNLETVGRSGAALSDTRSLTFFASGIDANGTAQSRSRTFTLMHDRLMTTE